MKIIQASRFLAMNQKTKSLIVSVDYILHIQDSFKSFFPSSTQTFLDLLKELILQVADSFVLFDKPMALGFSDVSPHKDMLF